MIVRIDLEDHQAATLVAELATLRCTLRIVAPGLVEDLHVLDGLRRALHDQLDEIGRAVAR